MQQKSVELKGEVERNVALEDRVARMVRGVLLRYDVVTLTHTLLGVYHGAVEEERSFVEDWGFGR